MKKIKELIAILLLPLCTSAEVLNCKVEQVSRLYENGTLGKHYSGFLQRDSDKHFSVNTVSGEISGIILDNTRPGFCFVKVSGGGDNDTNIISNCGGGSIDIIKISTWDKNKPFIAVDWIRSVYSGTCSKS